MKYIIRECSDPDFRFFFDGDCFTSAAGDFGYTVFTITSDYYGYCNHFDSFLNSDEFKDLWKEMEDVLTEVDDIKYGYSYYKNVKEVMKYYNLPYTSKNAHTLKTLADKNVGIDSFVEYLNIKTGKKWTSIGCSGYSQGDYVSVVFCPDFNDEETAEIIGDLYLGCGKEFCVINADDEDDTVYGYYVADCQGYRPEDYKSIVSADFGINEDDTVTLELIDSYTTIYRANYVTYQGG